MTSTSIQAKNKLVERVTENGFCTGCGICTAVAAPGKIKMEVSREGYLRPRVINELSQKETNDISEICPGVKVKHETDSSSAHTIWGQLISQQTGYANDAKVRRQGSSGGVITALLINLITSKKVDFVAQISASSSDPLSNELQISYTEDDVIRAAGSRYSPSAPLTQLRELLSTGKKFAFVGKPCDVSALRRFVNLNVQYKQQIPYMLSFMCAGIPSANGTIEVVKKLGVDPAKVVHFRYRGDGWPGMTRAIDAEGRTYEMDYNNSWGKILNRHLQFRCKICPDGTGEFADIVCADAWYGSNGYPDFTERDGRSLLLTRTTAGQNLVQAAVSSLSISVEDLDINEIAKMQPYQVERKRMVLGRQLGTFLSLGIAPKYSNLRLLKASLQAKPIAWLRSAVGTYRRTRKENQFHN